MIITPNYSLLITQEGIPQEHGAQTFVSHNVAAGLDMFTGVI